MSANHTLLGKVFHWAFVLLYAYGIFKQIDDLEQLEDAALLQFEILFASVFLLLVVIRYGYMRRFETFKAPSFPSTATTSASPASCTWRCTSPRLLPKDRVGHRGCSSKAWERKRSPWRRRSVCTASPPT